MLARPIKSLLLAGVLFLGGCVYKKPIVAYPEQSYTPNTSFPFSLAVEIPSQPRLFFECLSPCCAAYLPFELAVEEQTAQALAQKLNQAGFNAQARPTALTAGYDYTARVEFFPQFNAPQNCKLKPHYYKISSYEPFNAVLRVTIRHRKTQEVTAQYEESLFIQPQFSFSARVLSVIAPYTLGAFSPMQMQAMGGSLSTQIQTALQEMLDKIIRYMQEDKQLFTAPFSALQEEELSSSGRYQHLLQSVVHIHNPKTKSSGSAFFISANGCMLTAASLVKDTDEVDWTQSSAANSSVRRARVVARNTARNLALLKAEGEDFRPLVLSSQNPHRFKGEKVISLGSGKTPVTQGVLSGVSRINGTRSLLADSVFVTAHIGGPLVLGENAEVLGVNTATLEPGLTQAVGLFEIEKLFPQIITEIRP